MIYILHGTDKNRIAQKIQAIKNKHRIDNTLTFHAGNLEDDFLNEIDSFSIFDEEKMIIVEDASFLSAKNNTKYRPEDIEIRLDTDYILILCCYSEKLDMRKKAIKSIVNHKDTIVYACLPLDEKSQPQYINDLVKKYKLKMDKKCIHYLCNNVGMDPMHIEKEIEKLSVFSNTLQLEDLKALITVEPEQDIFKMTDAYFDRNALRLLAYYRNFRHQNMEPVAIVGLLSGQIRFLYQVSVLMDQNYSKDEIAGVLKAHPYRVQLSMKKASRFDSSELLSHLEELASFDQNMKLGKVDKDEGFEQFVLKMLIKG